jgi:hypothetical protein
VPIRIYGMLEVSVICVLEVRNISYNVPIGILSYLNARSFSHMRHRSIPYQLFIPIKVLMYCGC